MQRRFAQVDVFTDQILLGNPLAVVIDGGELSTEQMQQFASWTNLSETTFLLPPTSADADYAVRIFDPNREMPFAGHPTLGSCHVWLNTGGKPKRSEVIIQECAVGLVEVRPMEGGLAFAAPPLIRDGPVERDLASVVIEVLGLAPEDVIETRWIDNGPGWIGVLLADADAVLALEPDFGRHHNLDIGVAGHYPPGAEAAIEVRAFFRAEGSAAEDPVTGSLNAGFARWLLESRRLQTPYIASQGTRLGRRGRVYLEEDDHGTIWVGGRIAPCIAGHVDL